MVSEYRVLADMDGHLSDHTASASQTASALLTTNPDVSHVPVNCSNDSSLSCVTLRLWLLGLQGWEHVLVHHIRARGSEQSR